VVPIGLRVKFDQELDFYLRYSEPAPNKANMRARLPRKGEATRVSGLCDWHRTHSAHMQLQNNKWPTSVTWDNLNIRLKHHLVNLAQTATEPTRCVAFEAAVQFWQEKGKGYAT
jgi:hypothetical protein